MISRLDETFKFQEVAMDVRMQRQQILASNIANADTPHYKARDFDFRAALEKALGNKPEESQLYKTHNMHRNEAKNVLEKKFYKTDARHIHEVEGTREDKSVEMVAGVPLLYRTIEQGSVDGNTVDMDIERNHFTDNALRYEASVTILGQQIKSLIGVIQG